MNEAAMVRVEANLRQEGFVRLVAGQVQSLEEGLRFMALHAALGWPGWEDFVLLTAKRFVLEIEMDDAQEVAQLRVEAEAALDALGADWLMVEFDAHNNRNALRAKRNAHSWD